MITLRELSPDHWAEWRELRLEALREAPEAFCATYEDWKCAEEARWRQQMAEIPHNLLAEIDGKTAGIVSATEPDEHGTVSLQNLWVASSARGRAVGDILTDAVVEWAKSVAAQRVSLRVIETNQRAMALYRRCGFVANAATDGSREREMVYVFG